MTTQTQTEQTMINKMIDSTPAALTDTIVTTGSIVQELLLATTYTAQATLGTGLIVATATRLGAQKLAANTPTDIEGAEEKVESFFASLTNNNTKEA